jgi:hypothetical protein
VRGPIYSRIAAASGIGFVALIATVAIIGQVKDLPGYGDAAGASNEVFGTIALLTGVGAALLLWFVGTFAARVRQLEGGSGRLAAAVNTSGAIIVTFLTLGVTVLYAARSANSPGIARVATGIVDGPGMFFAAAVLVGAGGIVGFRARNNLPIYSRVLAMLSLPLSAAYIAGAGLMLFKNYAWINDTGYITFLAFTLCLSVIGVLRWSEMDESSWRPETPSVDIELEPAEVVPARKPAARRATAKVRRAS